MNIIFKGRKALIASLVAGSGLLASCDSLIFDDRSGCATSYTVSFRYEANVLRSDAFGRQVTGVGLYVFDSSGELARQYHIARPSTAENDFSIDLDLPAGRYGMLAWCTGTAAAADPVSFSISNAESPAATGDLSASLPLEHASDGRLFSAHDIVPLFHGISTDIELPEKPGKVDVGPLYLIKDTNRFNIILQNMNGEEMDPGTFSFEITGASSELSADNTPSAPEAFSYRPWEVQQTAVSGVRADDESRSGVVARLTTSRVMADSRQEVIVRIAGTAEEVIRFPLVDYLILVKDHYSLLETPQDYLDGVDEFTFSLFLEEGSTWAKARIFINGWRVVPKQESQM